MIYEVADIWSCRSIHYGAMKLQIYDVVALWSCRSIDLWSCKSIKLQIYNVKDLLMIDLCNCRSMLQTRRFKSFPKANNSWTFVFKYELCYMRFQMFLNDKTRSLHCIFHYFLYYYFTRWSFHNPQHVKTILKQAFIEMLCVWNLNDERKVKYKV